MTSRTEPEVNVNEVSRVSAGTTIKGEIYSPSDIRIDGSFEGRIYSRCKVVVGEKAVITGDIICSNVDFWGKIKGNFYVKDTLSLKDTSTVDGDINVRRFQVELDAKFNGNCHMITEDEFDKIVSDMIPGEGKAGKAQTPGTQVKL
ncbi:MAG: polymer-forming cytoskeletal protein [Bacteroidales bacterium]|jgi:cytoskeletal protein CcmA (bactofilin family)|nr:polymer-forming cytoskeletal protein [Bacteroidales bacterium]MBQ3996974.1 polymer-forming cytoskeletal protein [Bacteroidales bacterium]MBQ4306792.1 polymer-forming cytoskeletal protein [Bacteroidales bacterium]MBQ5944324.1 polymer-forming cytoskeletal protein [Bacteroidales bacterium]